MLTLPLSLLKSLWNNRKLVGVLLAFVALLASWAYVKHLRHRADELAADVARIEREADALTARAQEYQDKAQATIDKLAAENKAKDARLTRARSTERMIRDAAKNQDGGVAPVLFDSLGRMRQEPPAP